MKKQRLLRTLLAVALSATMAFGVAGCALNEDKGSDKNNSASASSGETIKVGILHSLSGTMAMSETSVRDAELLAIKEINASGGVLGKQIETVVEDGASDPATFAEKAQKLLTKDNVATVFGCWTSASRKAVLPVFESNKGLLWYPVQYEGQESSPNIFYTGAAPNQQIVPAIEYLVKNRGKKIFLVGSDYVFPRTANAIIKAQAKSLGAEIVGEEYTPMGYTDYTTIINKIKDTKPDFVFNTLNGDSNVAFFKQFKDSGLTPDQVQTCSVSVAEEEVAGIGASYMEGHLVAWNYYQTTQTEQNKKFVEAYKAEYGQDRVTDDPIEAGYNAVYLWAAAVKKAGSIDVDAVKKAAAGISFDAPEGKVTIDGDNQHLYKPVRIGKVNSNGLIDEVWSTDQPVKPDPYLKGYDWAQGLSANAK
ncbi:MULTISPECIES: urea ABC transporter substrate-binding protein [Clostridium]|uniref:Urea ABC transporter substrate-binding protein n=2 Tax=Clostridium TaxID=1485 RepID=A0A1S9N632_CLOBE|nr:MULTISPECIES: urea ABC transporter substrate-binding protein [Clostridium]EKQ54848.1 MAG: urea ABC transporter, urea binding protein [Clostridium sp. Maddingley MBC34-26]MZK51557.1 urea ABC transporter substrate-binding protein [Clostridium beijerinckii]MZK59832.1 urea ABC transporter substrate-binding protein [Clostridium beijerinckii]MZK70117.1 urea ABC transporter substrate-binding protein [Clostridium beijerinckii]MZK75360.1 urea ABC transporter substrate-binding protein [Clostridium be